MKIKCDSNDRITITPEVDSDIYSLGMWSHKIPMCCHYVADTNHKNKLTCVSIQLKHILELLESL